MSYSISFCFDGDARTAFIEMPIENLSADSPAAKYIRKKLAELGCEVIRHTYMWHCRQAGSRNRWCYSPMISFTGSDTALQQLVKLYGKPDQKVPDRPTRMFQDKFLWRCIVRNLFPAGTGTPVSLNSGHLPALENALARLDEFTSSSYSDGRVHYGGISRQDLASLPHLIEAIKQDGQALIID